MTKDGQKTRFTLADLPQKSTFRDKDNAQPRVPPPRMTQTPHPRLAPSGMSGIKPSSRLGMPPQAQANAQTQPKQKITLGSQGQAKRDFKPLAQPSMDKGLTRGR